VPWQHSQLLWLLNALHTHSDIRALTLDAQCTMDSAIVLAHFVSMLSVNRSITQLQLHGCSIDGATLARGVQQHPTLEALRLSQVEMDAAEMQALLLALLECQSLRSLHLEDNASAMTSTIADLCTLLRYSDSLHTLELTHCGLHGEPLRQLAEALSTDAPLRSLSLPRNELNDDDARCLADLLKKNRTLTKLDLSDNASIGDAGWRALTDALSGGRPDHTLAAGVLLRPTAQSYNVGSMPIPRGMEGGLPRQSEAPSRRVPLPLLAAPLLPLLLADEDDSAPSPIAQAGSPSYPAHFEGLSALDPVVHFASAASAAAAASGHVRPCARLP
jgi:hypothetical protein